eukprot:1790166-Pleurochrysis_carterae.AAC.3
MGRRHIASRKACFWAIGVWGPWRLPGSKLQRCSCCCGRDHVWQWCGDRMALGRLRWHGGCRHMRPTDVRRPLGPERMH